jgi:TMEM175 potassium channel family protein
VTPPPAPPDAPDDRPVSGIELTPGHEPDPLDGADIDLRAADRLVFFSDAVVAIAITLLAIDLPVPEGGTVAKFWASVQHNDGHYAAFLISFAVIASAWSDHHDLFRYVRRTDARLRLLDSVWLLMIILNPFATKLLLVSGQTLGTDALRFGFYALLQFLESALVYAMLRHLISHRLADIPPQAAVKQASESRDLMLGFGLSIPLFFVTTYAWLLWFLTPQVAMRVRRRLARNGRKPRSAA